MSRPRFPEILTLRGPPSGNLATFSIFRVSGILCFSAANPSPGRAVEGAPSFGRTPVHRETHATLIAHLQLGRAVSRAHPRQGREHRDAGRVGGEVGGRRNKVLSLVHAPAGPRGGQGDPALRRSRIRFRADRERGPAAWLVGLTDPSFSRAQGGLS